MQEVASQVNRGPKEQGGSGAKWGAAETIHDVQVGATVPDGTKLGTAHELIR